MTRLHSPDETLVRVKGREGPSLRAPAVRLAWPELSVKIIGCNRNRTSITIGNALRYRSGRSRIDDHFAMLEATLGLITFIENAELNSLDDEFPLAATFTMMAGGPICARIRWRDRAPRR